MTHFIITEGCWDGLAHSGFLITPDPIQRLQDTDFDNEAAQTLDSLLDDLPDLLANGTARATLDNLPAFSVLDVLDAYSEPPISAEDSHLVEKLFHAYSVLANAYVHDPAHPNTKRIPPQIARPFVFLGQILQRPPILAYAAHTLVNFKRLDATKPIEVDNMDVLYRFIHKRDAAWFTLIHVDIEARAAKAIGAIYEQQQQAVTNLDDVQISNILNRILTSLDAMMATLKRMPEHCHPHAYYHEVRPYIFGFEDVVFEGISAQPQSLHGETGAQSSIIPLFIRALGLQHHETDMTKYLTVMQDYMPVTHRNFIHHVANYPLRPVVEKLNQSALTDAFNSTLNRILAFRQMHLRYAVSYISNQDPEASKGTGGTDFRHWLQKLVDETEAQFL